MAQPKILRGTYITLFQGDGATPTELFTPICGINTRTMTEQVQTSDVFTRDCADPEDVPVRNVIATGRQWDLSGAGQMDRNSYENLKNKVGKTGNWRFEIGEPAADKVFGGYWEGPGMLTQLQITGADGDFVSIDVTIASDGEWDWTTVS